MARVDLVRFSWSLRPVDLHLAGDKTTRCGWYPPGRLQDRTGQPFQPHAASCPARRELSLLSGAQPQDRRQQRP